MTGEKFTLMQYSVHAILGLNHRGCAADVYAAETGYKFTVRKCPSKRVRLKGGHNNKRL